MDNRISRRLAEAVVTALLASSLHCSSVVTAASRSPDPRLQGLCVLKGAVQPKGEGWASRALLGMGEVRLHDLIMIAVDNWMHWMNITILSQWFYRKVRRKRAPQALKASPCFPPM